MYSIIRGFEKGLTIRKNLHNSFAILNSETAHIAVFSPFTTTTTQPEAQNRKF